MQGNNITVARNAGFCFGVKRATDALEKKLGERAAGERVFTLGHLIHNDVYNEKLRRMGVVSIGEQDIPAIAESADKDSPVTVFVRAHGIPVSTERALSEWAEKNPHFSYEDCTCPYVKKIHKIARENSGEDKFFALIGSHDHPEVIGIMSYVDGEGAVFANSSELESFLKSSELAKIHKKKLILAAQTTQNLTEWEKSQKIIKKLYTNSIFF